MNGPPACAWNRWIPWPAPPRICGTPAICQSGILRWGSEPQISAVSRSGFGSAAVAYRRIRFCSCFVGIPAGQCCHCRYPVDCKALATALRALNARMVRMEGSLAGYFGSMAGRGRSTISRGLPSCTVHRRVYLADFFGGKPRNAVAPRARSCKRTAVLAFAHCNNHRTHRNVSACRCAFRRIHVLRASRVRRVAVDRWGIVVGLSSRPSYSIGIIFTKLTAASWEVLTKKQKAIAAAVPAAAAILFPVASFSSNPAATVLCCRDFDRFSFGFFLLRQNDPENAVLVLGGDLIPVDCRRHSERSGKGSVLALNAMIVLFFCFFFEVTFTLEREDIVLKPHFDALGIHPGQFRLDDHFTIVFENVHRRIPCCRRQRSFPVFTKEAQPRRQRVEFTERIPSDE